MDTDDHESAVIWWDDSLADSGTDPDARDDGCLEK